MEFQNKSQAGKYWRRKGQEHEAEVRRILESEGYIVSKWGNNVDIATKTIIKAKFNRFSRSTGFPDFIAFRRLVDAGQEYEVILVEAKLRGVTALDKEEKEKIKILDDCYGLITKVM